MNKEPITVCIRCATYNHVNYLAQCLDGFVMQKTNFKYVAVVHDDCSTDGTTEVLRQYAARYPDIIIPLYEVENQYSKQDGSLDRIMNDAIAATGAKYIALCEGDDYWTDPLKLQKQVDFLESHPDFGLCCTRYRWFYHRSGVMSNSDQYEGMPGLADGQPGLEINKDNYFRIGKLPQVHTVMYRMNLLPEGHYYYKLKNRQDDALFYCAVQEAKIWVMNEVTGIYRKEVEGSATTKTPGYKQAQMLFDIFSDIYQYYPTDELREACKCQIESSNYIYIKQESSNKLLHIQYCWKEYRKYAHSFKDKLRFWKRTLRGEILHILKKY